MSALGKALSVAVKEWGWLEESPIRNVTKPSESEGRERFLSLQEREQLFKACRESRNPNLFPIVSLALITAMRFSEIAGLKWQDIDFDQRRITLLRTKNGDPDYVQQWRATANGLEGIATAHNDSLLCLDEMGQLDSNELGKVAYMLANGIGKTRADKLGNSRKRMQWRLLFLSSGEISLPDHMLEAKQRARAGQEVRVLDIPADGQKYGCFDDLHFFDQGKNFAEHLGDLFKAYHGTAGLEFLKHLLPLQEKVIPELRMLMTELSKKYVPPGASGQVQRAFNCFALVAVAGELASTFGITGWPEGTAIEAAIHCFNDWLRARGDIGPQEERSILSQVRHFFEQHGESRLSPWYTEDQEKLGKTQMRVGFRKMSDDGEEFFVFPESFKREICQGFDSVLVAQVCLKHKFLIPDSKGGATRSERLPGAKKSSRVYRFSSKVLMGDE